MTALVLTGVLLVVFGAVLTVWSYRPVSPDPARHRRPRTVSAASILARCAAEAAAMQEEFRVGARTPLPAGGAR
ncbi:hypothetical protein [Actinoalloteichus hymeniacidonis]|uniref:Uncharacterized protein n=1 Tax=Actinoalloteichus hymeniacidonis TaxID=340345 RepID=A0AAC9MX86_9PSEU|nr:hypothetical protein [Actinoalloteichus hymeniacidonis]AOS62055.1 hypothetical protein TL08_06150 [Actinoalloteichus hymeniacidonis]MBB5909923.1 hypothetical protein [Actinoalloteichus hymeniacidonis]